MKCQSQFSGKSEKIISEYRLLKFLPSMLCVNKTLTISTLCVDSADDKLMIVFFFSPNNKALIVHANCKHYIRILRRQFA